MEKLLKISLSLGVIIVSFSVAYYLVIYIPIRDKIEKENNKSVAQKTEFEACYKQCKNDGSGMVPLHCVNLCGRKSN